MRFVFVVAALMLSLFQPLSASAQDAGPRCGAPPIAKATPTALAALTEHGHVRTDEYAWLRDPKDPQVNAYLTAENNYARCHLAALAPLTEKIFGELRSRVGQEETRPPFFDHGYFYQVRYGADANYPTIVRGRPDSREQELVLDVPALADQEPYYSVDRWLVSPDARQVAFAVDLTGGRRHTLFLRDIASGRVTAVGIEDASADLAFSSDARSLFYVRLDPVTLRAYQVWRRNLDAQDGAQRDTLVYTEPDRRAEVSVHQSKSRKFIFIKSEREDSTEVRYVAADRPQDEFKIITPRRDGLRYFVDHVNGRFFVRTNLDAPDYRMMVAPEDHPGRWTEIIPNEPGKFLRAFQAFKDFIAVEQDADASQNVRIFRLSDLREVALPLPATAATISFDPEANREPDTHVIRLHFSRLDLPERAYDFDMAGGRLTVLPQSQTSDWLDPERYTVERLTAKAPDGEDVPVTLIYRKGLRQAYGNPTLLYSYGAYGESTLPDFDSSIFSLVDRGFIYALAHVRGGRDRGERWYVDGRQLKKRNSFTDFIAIGQTLIARGYTARHALFAQGASAGGLLVAASANMAPSLFTGIVAEVPFVDVVTTASDPSVPLSTLEYREWGDPAVKEDYEYMLSYSPYDNIARAAYPAMLVTGALYDTQVTIREPAKWVARLRALKTDHRELLFKVDMASGHHGPSGRLGSLKDTAEIQAWLVMQAGLTASAMREMPRRQ
jgi:oligopeptidase B